MFTFYRTSVERWSCSDLDCSPRDDRLRIGRCAQLAMADHMASDAADDRSLAASFGLRGFRREKCNRGRDNNEYRLNDTSPNADPMVQWPFRRSVPNLLDREERASGALRYPSSMFFQDEEDYDRNGKA